MNSNRKKELKDYDDLPNEKSEKWYKGFNIRELFKRKVSVDEVKKENGKNENDKSWITS